MAEQSHAIQSYPFVKQQLYISHLIPHLIIFMSPTHNNSKHYYFQT